MRKQNFIQGTILLIVVMALVKILGLINRFVIARALTPDGFSIYMLVMPTFILLISLAQLGFPISISKLVSENQIKKQLTNKAIVLSALKITIINSAVLITILILFARFLAVSLLHDERAYYPILALAIFIPLVALSGILKGYLNGLEIINIPAYSQLVEQVVRIVASLILIAVLMPYGITFAVTGSIIALSLGELISCLYMAVKILNRKNISYLFKPTVKKKEAMQEILSISLPTTGSRLIGSLTHFFEPIIFSTAMLQLGISSQYTTRLYGQISGYVVSTLIVPSFVVIAISTVLLPVITTEFASKNYKRIQEYFHLSLFLAFIVGAIYLIIIMLYPKQIMIIFFGTTEGTMFLYLMAPFFIIYFFEQPIAQTLHAIDKTKTMMISTFICNAIKLGLIYILVSYRSFHVYGLVISIILNIIMITLVNYLILYKSLKLKVNWYTIFMCIVLITLTYTMGLILKHNLRFNFFLSSIVITCFYLFLIFIFNIGNVKALKDQITFGLARKK